MPIHRNHMSRYRVWEGIVCRDLYGYFTKPLEDGMLPIDRELMRLICPCGSGLPSEQCHGLHNGSLVAGVWGKLTQLDVELSGYDTLCPIRCHECCKDYFYISAAEYFLLKNHLLRFAPSFFGEAKRIGTEQFALLAKKRPEEYSKLTSPANINASFTEGLQTFEFCPVLDRETGMCRAYPSRMLICRLHGSSSAYTLCDEIESQIKRNTDTLRCLSDIPYDEQLSENVDCFRAPSGRIVFQRPYPLIFWLTFDEAYSEQYNLAVSQPVGEYVKSLDKTP